MKVLVVGGGPAGAATAFFLAKAGVDVVVADRARFPRDKPCSEYLSPQALRVFHEMGALSAIESSGPTHLVGMRVQAPNGTTIRGDFAGSHRYRAFSDRGLAMRRIVLDAILLDRARAAGATVVEGVRVTDVIRDTNGRVKGVAAGNGKDGEILEADVVIGADGLRSVVGRRLGLIKTSRWPRRIALVTHFRGVAGLDSYGELSVSSNGYSGMASVGAGLANFTIVVPISRAPEIAGDRAEFLESWITGRPALAERFRHAEREGEVRATGPFATRARRSWVPGAALVGDAADFYDPFTGEGVYAALRGGEMLAEKLIEAANGRDEHRIDDALRKYEAARRREFAGKWKIERLVGATVGFAPLMNRAARVLSRRQDMADLIIGVGGDFVPTSEVLNPGFLLRVFVLPIA